MPSFEPTAKRPAMNDQDELLCECKPSLPPLTCSQEMDSWPKQLRWHSGLCTVLITTAFLSKANLTVAIANSWHSSNRVLSRPGICDHISRRQILVADQTNSTVSALERRTFNWQQNSCTLKFVSSLSRSCFTANDWAWQREFNHVHVLS